MSTFGFAWDLRGVDFRGFDVLNAHGDDWFLWGKKRPRHVHTFHGSCLSEMMNVKGLKGKLRMGMLALCEQPTVLLADVTVAVSDNTRRTIKGIQHVIPCGVDLDRFRPGKKADKPVILFVGTMHGRKRGRWLLKVFQEQVKPVIPDAELWCVCVRPDDIAEYEEQGVRWYGRISDEKLQSLYRSAWVFTLPSTYEGFGVPYIEAMASGTAVITTPNPGALEVTRAGQDGVIVEDDRLGAELVTVLTDVCVREAIVERGLLRSVDFGWDSVSERYEALYEGGKRKSRQQGRPIESGVMEPGNS